MQQSQIFERNANKQRDGKSTRKGEGEAGRPSHNAMPCHLSEQEAPSSLEVIAIAKSTIISLLK